MLIVAAEAVVEPDAVETVREALRRMEEETRKEPGCLAYAFSVDLNDASMIRIFERWESMDALKTHMKTPHMATFGAAVGKIQPKSVDIKAYEIEKEVSLPR